jgi:hypothetical protein
MSSEGSDMPDIDLIICKTSFNVVKDKAKKLEV